MWLRFALIGSLLCSTYFGHAQKKETDAIMDTTIYDFDEIFTELDALLDSLYTPRSFFVASANISQAYFQFGEGSLPTASSEQWLVMAPSLSYFHKSGFGLSANAAMINDYDSPNPYQGGLSVSYDYIRNRKFITGLSFTRFVNRQKLPFYISPLQNDVYGYFTYRNHWLKPSVGASYGWGNRHSVLQQTTNINKIKKKNNTPVETITSTSSESIADLNLMASIRHDFYFLHVLTQKGYLRLTPQLTFTGGSQQFGFNSTNNPVVRAAGRSGKTVVTGSQDITLNNTMNFQPLSLTGQLRTELSLKHFFIQPQVLVDYFFPAKENNITLLYSVTTGVIF